MATNLHFEPTEVEKWRVIARASAAVIIVTQRENGIWSYPINEEELGRYSDGSSHKAFYEKYGSYTATWSFLLALERLFGQIPAHVRRDLENWFEKHAPYGGAYGSPIPRGLGQQQRVDASARHTGYALLTRLRYLPDHRPDEWATIASWIVANKTPRFGWKHLPEDNVDDAMSTGACVAALAYFLSVASAQVDAYQADDYAKAIREGLEWLLSSIDNNRLWEGHRAGQTDVLDSALIIELFTLPAVTSQIGRIYPEERLVIKRLQRVMVASTKRNGWPAKFDGSDLSLASTINALLVTLDHFGSSRDNSVRQHAHTVCMFILDQIENHDGGSWLMGWEWAYLASLSSAILVAAQGHGLSEVERRHIQRQVLKVKKRKHILTKILALARLPLISFSPILFVLTKGRVSLTKDHVELMMLAQFVYKLASLAHKVFSWAR
jgi:hypothetical protein